MPMERTFADQGHQDELDAEMIYTTIEEQIVPKYYARNEKGIPTDWVASVKKCISDIASNFTTNRMLIDYEERFYYKLAERKKTLVANNYILAREIAAWKRKVSAAWDNVRVLDSQRVRVGNESMMLGEKYHFEVKVDVATLKPEEIGVELVVAKQVVGSQSPDVTLVEQLQLVKVEGSQATYALDVVPSRTGAFDIALRVYPKNANLPYRMDFALVKWA